MFKEIRLTAMLDEFGEIKTELNGINCDEYVIDKHELDEKLKTY